MKSPCLHTTKGYGGSGSTAPRILNVDRGCRCVIFLPGGWAPGTRCLGGWVYPRAVDDREPFVAAVNRTAISCRFYYLCFYFIWLMCTFIPCDASVLPLVYLDIWLALHHSITYLLFPTRYTNLLFVYTNYIKLDSSTCFERIPPIIRRSTT